MGKWVNGTGALILSFAIAKPVFSNVLSVQERLKEVPNALSSNDANGNDLAKLKKTNATRRLTDEVPGDLS